MTSEELDLRRRKSMQIKNEHRIEALSWVHGIVVHYVLSEGANGRECPMLKEVLNILRERLLKRRMSLPKDHEKYMDQQGDKPNKKG